MATEEELQHELMYYTLAHGDPAFIHQHVVDAFAAQNATEESKPIAVVFALIGLYLHLDRGFTGRQVQRAHMQLGTPRRTWSMPELPEHRGAVRVGDVLESRPGQERDIMIDVWCNSVWEGLRRSAWADGGDGRSGAGRVVSARPQGHIDNGRGSRLVIH